MDKIIRFDDFVAKCIRVVNRKLGQWTGKSNFFFARVCFLFSAVTILGYIIWSMTLDALWGIKALGAIIMIIFIIPSGRYAYLMIARIEKDVLAIRNGEKEHADKDIARYFFQVKMTRWCPLFLALIFFCLIAPTLVFVPSFSFIILLPLTMFFCALYVYFLTIINLPPPRKRKRSLKWLLDLLRDLKERLSPAPPLPEPGPV